MLFAPLSSAGVKAPIRATTAWIQADGGGLPFVPSSASAAAHEVSMSSTNTSYRVAAGQDVLQTPPFFVAA